MDCAARGSTWPAVANTTVKAGTRACTTSVTPTGAGLPPAPEAVICAVAAYVPAAKVARLTETVSEAGAVPEAGERLSHDAPDEAAQERIPPPAFVIETACAAGAVPPTV